MGHVDAKRKSIVKNSLIIKLGFLLLFIFISIKNIIICIINSLTEFRIAYDHTSSIIAYSYYFCNMVVCYSECLPFIFIQAVHLLPLSMFLPSRAEMRRGDGGDMVRPEESAAISWLHAVLLLTAAGPQFMPCLNGFRLYFHSAM